MAEPAGVRNFHVQRADDKVGGDLDWDSVFIIRDPNFYRILPTEKFIPGHGWGEDEGVKSGDFGFNSLLPFIC